jgi:hypothetical protein
LLAWLPAFLPAHMPTCLHMSIASCRLTSVPALSPSCQPDYLLSSSLQVCLSTFLMPATFQIAYTPCLPCLLKNLHPTQSEDMWNKLMLLVCTST